MKRLCSGIGRKKQLFVRSVQLLQVNDFASIFDAGFLTGKELA